jgi:hypothetical protein
MPAASRMPAEIQDVEPGLWIWRLAYPDWRPEVGWPQHVTATCVESGGEVAVVDPLAPPESSDVWQRFDERPPTMAVVLKPDHVRDVDLFVSRYGVRAFGPWLFWRPNVPDTELEPIEPGSELPGGLRALCSRAGCERSTTAVAGTRRRSGYRSGRRSSSRTR